MRRAAARHAAVVALIVVATWSAGVATLAAQDLEDLLWDLQIVPLDDPPPPCSRRRARSAAPRARGSRGTGSRAATGRSPSSAAAH